MSSLSIPAAENRSPINVQILRLNQLSKLNRIILTFLLGFKSYQLPVIRENVFVGQRSFAISSALGCNSLKWNLFGFQRPITYALWRTEFTGLLPYPLQEALKNILIITCWWFWVVRVNNPTLQISGRCEAEKQSETQFRYFKVAFWLTVNKIG